MDRRRHCRTAGHRSGGRRQRLLQIVAAGLRDSCESHKLTLANPMVLARQKLEKRLDTQTAFAIVSLDIADGDVGQNIGPRLQAD